MSGKNEAARELVRLRWSKTTPEERRDWGRKLRAYPRKPKPTNKKQDK
jgi:hypothetical protein